MRRLLSVLAISLFVSPLAAHAQFQPQYDPRLNLGSPAQDEDFLKNSMDNASAEIEWSRIANAKSSNPDVKALASETISEETQIAGRLVAEAGARKVKVPKSLIGKHKKESDKLNGLSGAAFDKEYTSALVKLQHDDVGEMLEEAKSSKVTSLQDFAVKTGDEVAARNDKAKALEKQVEGK